MKALIGHGVAAVSAALGAAYRLRGAFDAFEITRDLAYGRDPLQRCDVWRLRAPSRVPRPLVLFLHGGGFQHLDPASHWAFAERFASAGAVVVSAGYRLAPAHRYPAAADDAARALDYALTRARWLGADPRALIVAGTSAGANLALGLAITHAERDRVAPRACVLFSGLLQVSDLPRLYRDRPLPHPLRARIASIACDYVGGDAVWRLPDTADPRLDPLLYLERATTLPARLPAVFCSTGSRDQVLSDAERLHARLVRGEHPSTLDVVDGAGHAFQGFLPLHSTRAVWERVFAFLRAQGFQLEGASASGVAS